MSDIELTQTKKLEKVKKVDPLGVIDLKTIDVWHIDNHNKIFDYVYEYDESKDFQLICLMSKKKYDGLPVEDKEAVEILSADEVEILDVKIKNPHNFVELVKSKLLVFKKL